MSRLVLLYRYIPNALTVLRMLSAPFLFYAITAHDFIFALALVTFAIASDMGDGYAARRLFVSSKSGSFLDPLADKAVIIAAFAALCMQWIVPWWVLGVIIGRDVSITWLRIFLLRHGVSLRTSWLAKSKTAFQFMALYVFIIGMYYPHFFSDVARVHIFYGVSVATAVLTLLSSLGYVLYWGRMVRTRGSKEC